MGSHSVDCHSTQATQPDRPVLDLPTEEGDRRPSWPWCWFYTEMFYLSTASHT